ncbi:MAG TPA: hypothetical protein VMS54_12095 [Vicinamibacterales bacterium]|nr:hypothetical protein [Vicinamibacterales bacterium]
MINPACTFHYVGQIDAGAIRESEIRVQARAAAESPYGRWAGSTPFLRFYEDLCTVVATPGDGAEIKWFCYYCGDVVCRAARPGDQIEVVRNFNASLAVVLRREGAVVVAVGALADSLLEPQMSVRCDALGATVRVGGERRAVLVREPAIVGGYDVCVERGDHHGLDTPSGCVSIATASDGVLVNAARRSAVLLAHQAFEALRGERSDGGYIKD